VSSITCCTEVSSMQLRGAIDKRPRSRRLPASGSVEPASAAQARESARCESLDRLEDSLIGNDVLVEESRQHSNALLEVVRPCLGSDRYALPQCAVLRVEFIFRFETPRRARPACGHHTLK
jgi:hypothetical protein